MYMKIWISYIIIKSDFPSSKKNKHMFGSFPEMKMPDFKMPEFKMPDIKFPKIEPVDADKIRKYVPGSHETFQGKQSNTYYEYSNINGKESSKAGAAELTNNNGEVKEMIYETSS